MLKRITLCGLVGMMIIVLGLGISFQVVAADDPMFEEDEKATTDWEKSVVRAKGYGVAPDYASSSAQAKIMAREAAITMAQRRLLETIKGVKIDSTQTVKNAQVKSDVVKKRVSGVIKGAQIIEEKRPAEDVYRVVMEVKFYGKDGVMKAILPNLKERTNQKQGTQNKSQTDNQGDNREEAFSDQDSNGKNQDKQSRVNTDYTGIIINTINLDVEPAMAPKIYGPNNKLIYGMNKVASNEVITNGIVGYSRSLSGAKSKARIGNKPLIINAEQVKGEYTTDLVLSAKDARQVSGLGQQTDIFNKCKIIIVLN